MNPFERHGITHISVSQLNLWAAAPGVYVMERLLGLKAPVGAAAHRGTAVEAGVIAGLMGEAVSAATDIANAVFTEKTALSSDPRLDKEKGSLAGMVEQGIRLLSPWGRPDRIQVRKEWRMDGIVVPVLGFSDLEYDAHGLIVDLKTAHALASQIRTSHARQVASYLGAGANMGGGVAYVTAKKNALYRLENAAAHVAALTRMAHSLQNFLAISADSHELASLVTVDTDSFYLSDPRARQHAFDVFGV
ncbi:PD-(D/E)XK nuclease family protein [Pararhizobium haloflavum]|uniref:PD-(D/E)XK nuclease family protein n=1 Tax=Pararhizobium haloflavum TaxID=2037914 RepID=UPI000C198CB8|nr:PD-(D/E)XK nuclease family protein [Pararhizobium haloflavum]